MRLPAIIRLYPSITNACPFFISPFQKIFCFSPLLAPFGGNPLHDPAAALEYAQKLLPLKKQYEKELLIVMRVYFEKPRTTVGWKGLINDPHLDGTFDINFGLRQARVFLLMI